MQKGVRKVLIMFLLLTNGISFSQCPTSAFSIDASVCMNQQIDVTNNSLNGVNYEWDFCDGALLADPTLESTSSSVSGFKTGLKLIQDDDGLWYGFVVNFTQESITRLDFGTSPDQDPTGQEDLNITPASLLDGPIDIDFTKEGGNWYAIVTNLTTSSLTLLDFGTSLSNDTPDVTAVNVNPSNAINSPFGISLIDDNGSLHAMVSNYNSSSAILDFSSGITSTADAETIAIGSNTWFALITKECNEWFGYASTDAGIFFLEFGTDLSSPAVSVLALDSGLPRIGKLLYNYAAGNHYLLASSTVDGHVYRVDLGASLSNGTGTVTDLEGTPSFSTPFSDLRAFDNVKIGSDYHYYGINVSGSGTVYRINFSSQCSNSTNYNSSEFEPTGVTYETDGSYNVSLFVEDANGHIDRSSQAITVTTSTAPDISFSVSSSQCISNSNVFSSSASGLTYSWDFDGDGMEDSNEENPEVKYDTLGGVGTYSVRLDVSDGTCTNFFEQEITIYDPPPAPSYTYSSARTCINADFTFTNTTVDGAYTGPLEYLWEFIDESSGIVVATANTKDAVYAFETEGQKTVRLTSSIPGCTDMTEQTLMITPGPTANFFAASVCQDEAMQFTNTSTDAISYSWDFGDGFMSTATNPSHIFNGAGNFFVTLTATDTEGCEDTEVIEVAVSDSPQISFDFDVPCTSSSGIQFTDLTTVDNADLVSWTWFVDDVEVSTDRSPQIVFSSTGIKTIRLDVQSSNGCESSYSEDIDVLVSPTADFNVNLGCQGEVSTFTDNTSSSGNSIVSWLWTVDGVNYGTQDINHIFSDAGTYDVTLEVTGQNFWFRDYYKVY